MPCPRATASQFCIPPPLARWRWDVASPDHANADVILLVSAHLEAGTTSTRARNGSSKAPTTAPSSSSSTCDSRTPPPTRTTGSQPYPGSEAAILLAIASFLIRTGRYDRDFVRRWWNWKEYMAAEKPGSQAHVRSFRGISGRALSWVHLCLCREKMRAAGCHWQLLAWSVKLLDGLARERIHSA